MHRLGSAMLSMVPLTLLLGGCVAMSTFEAKEQEAQKVRSELQAARAAERRLGSELEAIRQERSILERDLSETRSSLGATGQRTRALESDIARLSRGAEEKEREIGSLRGAIGEREREFARLQRESAEKEQEIARLKSMHDDLVKDLKKEIEAGEIKVTQYKDLLTVNLVEKVLFDSGKAEIKPRGLEILRRVGDILKNAKDKQIQIEGHTDNIPIGPALTTKYPTNWELSTARATVVARYFQERVGIPPQRLTPAGFAEYRPVASNDTPEGRSVNRRIEIILAPVRLSPTAG